MRVVCYGVRETEVPYFNNLNKYNYDLVLVPELLNHDNVKVAEGANAVITRGNCKADAQNMAVLAGYGVEYVLTRTVGYNHVDIAAGVKHGFKMARVSEYSPNAIAELAVTLAMMLVRNTAYTVNKTKNKDFRVDAQMFSKEIRNCTVGIIGVGKIGLTTAKLFKGLGAKVVAYDIYESDEAKEVVEFMSQEELLKVSDVVSIHMPWIKGQNDKVINREFIDLMKDDAILINTSRGEVQDDDAIYEALTTGKLQSFGTDVFAREAEFFFKDMTGLDLPYEPAEKLLNLYPQVLVTPHMGSYTDEALTNMIEMSYDNINDFVTTGECCNELK